jgi:hypothetical protein
LFTDFIQCCNVTNSIVPFFLSKFFVVGASSLAVMDLFVAGREQSAVDKQNKPPS